MGTISTTEMQVTSIRLERDLKDRLKDLAGTKGYQALIREVLWDYVRLRTDDCERPIVPADIRAVVPARATQEQRCALTGSVIPGNSECFLGMTLSGDIVTLSSESQHG